MNKRNEGDDAFKSAFSLSDFKKWMENQQKDESPRKDLVGATVEPKIGLRKLLSKIEIEDGDLEEAAKEFKENGGIVSEVDGNKLLVEVESGSFIIHKIYVRRAN